MKLITKLTAVALAGGMLSGCSTLDNHPRAKDYIACTVGGAAVGAAIGAAANSDNDEMHAGAAIGAGLAALFCPEMYSAPAPECAIEPVEGATLDANGCAFDSDSDGVVDGLDHCADTPVGVEVDAMGCALDSDNDGVPDYMDDCPNTAEGTVVGPNGCPVSGEVILSLTGVHFAFDKAALTPEAEAVLDEAVAVLKDVDGQVEVLVEGHTDSRGSAEYNLKLSEERAQSVVHYLVTRGVDADHLVAVGMGESYPVASNDTEAGRAMNRRVDFVIK